MRNSQHPEAIEDTIMREALLYAAGELDADAAEAFEHQLAADQVARDALAQAVHLTLLVVGSAPTKPNPKYRAVVRDRVMRRGPWTWLVSRRLYVGHPAVWAGIGATAMALLIALPGWRTGETLPDSNPNLNGPIQMVLQPNVAISDDPLRGDVVPEVLTPSNDALVNTADLPDDNRDTQLDEPQRQKPRRVDPKGPNSVTESTRVASPTRSR